MNREVQRNDPPPPDVQEALLARPEPGHVLGPVNNDWEAAEVWLDTVRLRSKNGSNETEKTYRHHLAKLRWYCEHVGRVTPSRWSLADVKHFLAFLADVPADAIRSKGGPTGGQGGATPFQCQPSPSSQADIRRCVHALFAKWHAAGYVRINPMALIGAGNLRSVDTQRAVSVDLFDQVLAIMAQAAKTTFTERQACVRDVFILEALRGMGLRSSELVGATMNAFSPVTVIKTGKRYWVFTVSAHTGKGGKARPVPVPVAVWEAFIQYRAAFGLPPHPDPDDTMRLILSPRTHGVAIHSQTLAHTGSRRYFKLWREVKTRQGLYLIVTGRFEQAAKQLALRGNLLGAQQLRRASTHWLRHTFGKAALLSGHAMRGVAGALGHADMATTMIYTEQDAQDLIEAWELANPGSVAAEGIV